MSLVAEALRPCGVPVVFLDQRGVTDMDIPLEVDAAVSGSVQLPTGIVDLSDVTSVYLRPYETERMPAVRAAGIGGPAGLVPSRWTICSFLGPTLLRPWLSTGHRRWPRTGLSPFKPRGLNDSVFTIRRR
jgi:hypothetical protein